MPIGRAKRVFWAVTLLCMMESLWTCVSQSFQSLSHVRLFVTPWTAARQASLSITNSRILLKPMSIESVMPSNHLILCRPLLLLPLIFPSIRVFSNEPVLRIRWLKYWIIESEVAQSCLTLCDPMDCSLPVSLVHGIFQARVLEWLAITHLPKTIRMYNTKSES